MWRLGCARSDAIKFDPLSKMFHPLIRYSGRGVGPPGETMLEHLEQQTRLTGNQIRLLVVTIICNLLEFYDLFLVGFVLAFVAGPWKLTYGPSAMMLLSSGRGAIRGAGVWGWVADAIGRRKVLMATVINFSIASGIL